MLSANAFRSKQVGLNLAFGVDKRQIGNPEIMSRPQRKTQKA